MAINLSRAQMRELLIGDAPENLSCLALKIRLGQLRLAATLDPSLATLEALVDSLGDFLTKNEAITVSDVKTLSRKAHGMNHVLYSVEDTCRLIQGKKPLLLAGAEQLLRQLPKGDWIGGTIPYFMGDDGCALDENRIFVTELPPQAIGGSVKLYNLETIPQIANDAYVNGLSLLVLPAFSAIHEEYAKGAPGYEGMYLRPIAGWVAGTSTSELGKVSPKVFFGPTGKISSEHAVALHIELPPTCTANIDIVNLFTPGSGPDIEFSATSFEAGDCLIGGQRRNLAAYIDEEKIDTRLPLVADLCGAVLNTSIAEINRKTKVVKFFAPVFKGIRYRVASQIGKYAEEFKLLMPQTADLAFSCNCILNYVYGELEGKSLGNIRGPMTFGEVAYQLLNQTLVYVEIEEAA
jgi:hypothetical protein